MVEIVRLGCGKRRTFGKSKLLIYWYSSQMVEILEGENESKKEEYS